MTNPDGRLLAGDSSSINEVFQDARFSGFLTTSRVVTQRRSVEMSSGTRNFSGPVHIT